MITAHYDCLGWNSETSQTATFCNGFARISSRDIQTSFNIQCEGKIVDIIMQKSNIYCLYCSNNCYFVEKETVYGQALAVVELGQAVVEKPLFSVMKYENYTVIGFSEEKAVSLVADTKTISLQCQQDVKQILSFADSIIVLLEGGRLLVYELVGDEAQLVKTLKSTMFYCFPYLDYLYLDNKKCYDINFELVDEQLIQFERQASSWIISGFSTTQNLSGQELQLFIRELHFGFSVIPPANESKFEVRNTFVSYNNTTFDCKEVSKEAGMLSIDKVVNFWDLQDVIIFEVVFREEYYLLANEVAANKALILQQEPEQMWIYEENCKIAEVAQLKQKLVIYTKYELIIDETHEFIYDQPIIEISRLNSEQFYALTCFEQQTKIYLEYEVVFHDAVDAASFTNIDNILVVSTETKLIYAYEQFSAQEAFSVQSGEKLAYQNGRVLLVSELEEGQVQSELLDFVVELKQAIEGGKELTFALLPDEEFIKQLFTFVMSAQCHLSDSNKSTLLEICMKSMDSTHFATVLPELLSMEVAYNGIGKCIIEKFDAADERQQYAMFRTLEEKLQQTRYRGLQIPHFEVDLNQNFLFTLLTSLYLRGAFKMFIILTQQMGIPLGSVLDFLFDDYSRLRRRCNKFLSKIKPKIKVISLFSLSFDSFQQARLKAYLIALYDLFDLNPINQRRQQLNETDPLRVKSMTRKQFKLLQFGENVEGYYKQLTSAAKQAEFEYEAPGVIFTKVNYEEETAEAQGQEMEVAEDDDWQLETRRIRKFKIKAQ